MTHPYCSLYPKAVGTVGPLLPPLLHATRKAGSAAIAGRSGPTAQPGGGGGPPWSKMASQPGPMNRLPPSSSSESASSTRMGAERPYSASAASRFSAAGSRASRSAICVAKSNSPSSTSSSSTASSGGLVAMRTRGSGARRGASCQHFRASPPGRASNASHAGTHRPLVTRAPPEAQSEGVNTCDLVGQAGLALDPGILTGPGTGPVPVTTPFNTGR
ncbi:hypothetical protein T492DRAFT_1142795 [Pavlovales sp. CCMP2436]|nr:hypothetical protein T492DRAFT_1142795 [Pavlovales sp. CCMP2436]